MLAKEMIVKNFSPPSVCKSWSNPACLMTGFQPSHQQWRPWLAFPHSGYWLTCHLTARLTHELLQYMHKGTLAWAVQHGTIRSRKRPWVHWEFKGNCFLDVYFWSALANHHESDKKRPILLQLYHLNSCFHLDNLTTAWSSLELHFPHSQPEVNLSCFQPFIYKCVEQFSTCFTLLTEVVLDFLRHDLSGDQIIQVIVRSWILAYRKRINVKLLILLLLTAVHLYPLLRQ